MSQDETQAGSACSAVVRHASDFEEGILYAAGILASFYDQPSIAAEIVVDAGLGCWDISQMDECDKRHLALIANERGIHFKTA